MKKKKTNGKKDYLNTSVFMCHIRDVTLLQKTTNPLQGSL